MRTNGMTKGRASKPASEKQKQLAADEHRKRRIAPRMHRFPFPPLSQVNLCLKANPLKHQLKTGSWWCAVEHKSPKARN
jgi:hypothetical protein